MMYWLIKTILKPTLHGVYRIRVDGLDNVPRKGAVIVAANHISFLDSFFIPLIIRRRKVTYLAKADYFKNWRTAWFFRSVGQISCERQGGKKSQQSLAIASEVLAAGGTLGIYPEGTRSPDGYLHKGRTGVARLAVESGAVVVPCGIAGTEEVMPKSAKFPRLRGRIEVRIRFGRPLDFSRYAGKEKDRHVLRSVTDEIMHEIIELSGQEYRDDYASRRAELPLPDAARAQADDDDDLSDEVLAG